MLKLVLISAPIIFTILLFLSAPYGRHNRSGWGLQMDNRWAWFWMELPAVLTISLLYLYYQPKGTPSLLFLALWLFHYCYRTFYFPTQLKKSNRSFPITLVFSAVFFNIVNGAINGIYLFDIRPIASIEWFYQPITIIGLSIFFTGFIIHYTSDRIILNLRSDQDSSRYHIPYGGLFKYVTNPNYLGEFMQWIGWAIVTWSIAGLAFAIFTLANLLPRAIANHNWYHEKFSDYPQKRKVFFPFIF